MVEFLCPDCKDTGLYQGLFAVEPCRACGGKKRQEIPPLYQSGWLTRNEARRINALSGQSVERFVKDQLCEQVAKETGGQSIRHELEEQITEKPFELHIHGTERTRISSGDGYVTLDAIQFNHTKEETESIGEAFLSGNPIKVTCTFQNGRAVSRMARISGWCVVFATMEGSITLIEQGPADA